MASDDADFERARLFGRGALLFGLVTGALVLAHAASAWSYIPERVPTHFGGSGVPDAWGVKSFPTVFIMPIMAMLFGPGIAAMALASVWDGHLPGADRPSLRSALPFLANFLSGLSVLASVLLSGIAFGATRVAAGQATSIGWWPLVGGIGLGLWAIVGSILMLAKFTPLHGVSSKEDDASRWKWGVFYVAPEDPSLFVEKRWGGGYTINFGIPAGRAMGWAFLAFFLVMGGLVAWAVAAS